MSLVGKQYPSEIKKKVDPKTGRTVYQLTETGTSYHFYFTENSFTEGDEEILYMHTDDPYGGPQRFELYSMDLKSGVRTQLSELSGKFKDYGFLTKSVNSKIVLCYGDGDLYRFDRESADVTLLYKVPSGFMISGATISHDNRYVAILLCERVKFDRAFKPTNYDGFTEEFYGYKRGRIVLITMDGRESWVVHQDTHWLDHIQFAPDTNEYLTYCHEGPWHMVQQRIWIFNTLTRSAYPCYRQKQEDSVGHEFWTRNGLIFFDNRGPGHDGSITVDKTQAVATDSTDGHAIPKVGFADREGNILRTIELPYYCNHYHANKDATVLVGDALEDIMLIDVSGDEPRYQALCQHNTSWLAHQTHPHPTWSWSNNKILFASDSGVLGESQLFLVDMTE